MKAKLSFPLALAANLALLSVCLLWRGGGPVVFSLLSLLHIVLFLLNNYTAKRWWQVLVLGLTHIAATYCVHQQTGWLYFRYIVDDVEGHMVSTLGCFVGVVWTIVLLIASLIWFGVKQRKAKPVE